MTDVHSPDPAFENRVRALFDAAPFVRSTGIRPVRVASGVVESALDVAPAHLQQDGFVHAGVLGTMADHTAGAAALSLVAADQTVLSIEYKLNLLRPAKGERLVCRAAVLRAGRTITVAEAEVFVAIDGPDAREVLVAKATVTLANVRADVGAAR